MKTNSKKVYKIKEKGLEEKLLKNAIEYLKFRGAYMIFPFKEKTKDGWVYGKMEVKLKINFYKD